MKVNTKTMVSITEANQNFSKVARLVDEYGSALFLKNNKPRYIITEFSQVEGIKTPTDDEIRSVSDYLIKQNAKVYEELTK